MVFEVEEAISDFSRALNKVAGLTLVDEDELELEDGVKPHLYLLVPNFAALQNIEGLWRRWSSGRGLPEGYSSWRDIFKMLRDIRPWGPQDRLGEFGRELLTDEIDGRDPDELITLEIEIVFREQIDRAQDYETALTGEIVRRDGEIVSRAYIPTIHYHAMLVKLPVAQVQAIVDLDMNSIAGQEAVMYICPQTLATRIELDDEDKGNANPDRPGGFPILALLDGVPVAGHAELVGRLIVDDQLGIEGEADLQDRVHGTAMASLITRGDLNVEQPGLPRPIHVIPVLGRNEEFPSNRLIVDVIYSVVRNMLVGAAASAPQVLIVNISLGNRRSLFDRRVSAWARLLDRLAYDHGLLFLVSAGNHGSPFPINAYDNWNHFEDAGHEQRSAATLGGLKDHVRLRRLLSPAESVNALTIGAANQDNVEDIQRRGKRGVDPYQAMTMANPSCAMGPGFGNSVKPDLMFPGGREHVDLNRTGGGLSVAPSGMSRAHGLKVASPSTGAIENPTRFSGNTSGATALASRAAHQIHDALEATYGEAFLAMSKHARSVLLKALLVHTATWPKDTAAFIKSVMGPADGRQHVKQKDNIRRLIGYGIANPELAIACIDDRATFWATGTLHADRGVSIDVPIPACIGARAQPHHIQVTLAWTTLVSASRKAYRNVRLVLEEPDDLQNLGVEGGKFQPDQNQGRRGTVYSRCWEGDKAAVLAPDHTLRLWVQRQPDLTDGNATEAVPFGLAVTVAMPSVNEVYTQVLQRVAPPAQVRL